VGWGIGNRLLPVPVIFTMNTEIYKPSTAEDYAEYDEFLQSLEKERLENSHPLDPYFWSHVRLSLVYDPSHPCVWGDRKNTVTGTPLTARQLEERKILQPRRMWSRISDLLFRITERRCDAANRAFMFVALRFFNIGRHFADCRPSFTGTSYENLVDATPIEIDWYTFRLRQDTDVKLVDWSDNNICHPVSDAESDFYFFVHNKVFLAYDRFVRHGTIGDVTELACTICADLSAARGEAYTRGRLEWLIQSLDGFSERTFAMHEYSERPFSRYWESCDFVTACREEIIRLHATFAKRDEQFRMVCRGRHKKSNSFLRSISDEHFKLIVDKSDLRALGPIPREEWGRLVTEEDFRRHPLTRRWGVRAPAQPTPIRREPTWLYEAVACHCNAYDSSEDISALRTFVVGL